MNDRIYVLRESVVKITQMLSGKGIQVTQRGVNAYVKSDSSGKPVLVNLPYIPDNAKEDLVNAIQGFLDHEVAHILFSDFQILEKADKLGVHSILNILEDARIEKAMGQRFQGSASNLSVTGKFFLDKYTISKMQEAAFENDPKKMIGVLMVPLIRSMSGQHIFTDFMADKMGMIGPVYDKIKDLAPKMEAAQSTQDCFDLALEIQKRIRDNQKPKSEGESDQKGEGEGKGTDEDSANGSSDKGGKSGKGRKSKKSEPKPKEEPQPELEENDGEGEGESDSAEDGKDGEEDKEPENTSGKGSDAEEDQDEGDDSDDADEDAEDADEEDESDESDEDADDESHEDEDEDADDGEDESEEWEDDDGDDDSSGGIAQGEEDGNGDDGADTSSAKAEAQDAEQINLQEDQSTWDAIDKENANGYDKNMSAIISDNTAEAAKHADYIIYTKDGDVVEPLHVGNGYRPQMFKEDVQDKVEHMVGPLQKDLERAISARSLSTFSNGHRSGRLHAANLSRLAVGDDRVFRRKHDAVSKDVAVSLVVDASGSMMGQKIHLATQAAYALSSVLERLHIAHEVICFTTGPVIGTPTQLHLEQQKIGRRYARSISIYMPILKSFNERLNTSIKERFGWLPNSSIMQSNIDGESIEVAARRLMTRKENGKILIVLSDGYPAGDGDNGALKQHLRGTVKTLTKQGVNVVGIGILSDAVKDFYPKNVVLNKVDELPGRVMKELRQLLIPK